MSSHLPDFFLSEDIEQAKKYHDKVGEIFFFEKSFEVEIKDPLLKKTFFPFMSLSPNGEILDYFCSCKESETRNSCWHMALAYLTLVPFEKAPLHIRFQQSFWKNLLEVYSHRLGFDAKIFQKEKNQYFVNSETHIQLLSFTFFSKVFEKRFQEICSPKEQKEGKISLKLSSFTPEEIEAWKEHRATEEIEFKLSFWNDLASWLFLLQEKKEPYQVEFIKEKQKLPHRMVVEFSQKVRLEFFLSSATWQKILPFLDTLETPLKLSRIDEEIEEILFEKEKFQFQLKVKEKKISYPKEGIEIDGWIYVEDQGFYTKSIKQLFKEKEISQENIPSTLSKYPQLFQKYVKNVEIHFEKTPLKYHLFFDRENALHIEPFLFEKGDLQKKSSFLKEGWAYLEDQGFFALEEMLFPSAFNVIFKEEVGHFVTTHRLWLHNFPNFQTHFGSLSFHFSYEVTDEGELVFDSKMDLSDQWSDFGEWIYVRHTGFFAKPFQGMLLPLRPGLRIPKDEVENFIRNHTFILHEVPSFFTPFCPYEKMGLSIFLDEKENLQVKMEYQFLPEIDKNDLIFYDRYIFIKKRGFFEISYPKPALLEKYSSPKTILKSEELYFLKIELDALKPYILNIDPRLKKPSQLIVKIRQIKKIWKKGTFLYEVDLVYESELGHVKAYELLKALRENQKFLFTQAGLIFPTELRFSWLKNLTLESVKNEIFYLSPLQWIRLSLFENISPPKGESKEEKEARKFLQELETFSTEEFLLDPSLLKAELRPYQQLGLKWLWFLYCHGLSGLLCDEMGLGKSHQAMALLASAASQDPQHMNKYLIITPTSVLYHWEELFKTFLPSFKVFSYHGSKRSLEEFPEKYDVFLTSYAIHRIDEKEIQQINFEIAIFDEIQIGKNPSSKTHKALKNILSKMKIGLTGTPIENRLEELKALFDIVLPSYLPSEAFFRENFIIPIEKNGDEERKNLLFRLIHPFILRRKKNQVLLDLPEKMEQLAFCDLSQEQKNLYHQVLLQSKEQIYSALKEKTEPVPYAHIFSIFSRLKQICDHPSLLEKDEDYFKHESGKWDLFVELLNEAMESKQKVVVFSQYLEMLKIIETYLKKKSIGFAGIKGSTRNRQEQLRKFREDPRCEVFVGSLFAVGLGVDLSSASVVIHYDRWWNPARENQATDRVHRIGQTRGVQIFKLVTKNSIEEHIHLILEKKRELFEKIVVQDESDQMKVLSREDLLEVLEKIYSADSFLG